MKLPELLNLQGLKFEIFAMRGLLEQFAEIIFQELHKGALCHIVCLCSSDAFSSLKLLRQGADYCLLLRC